MFDSFENRFDTDPHRILQEQLTRVVENIEVNTVFMITERAVVVDRTGDVYLELDEKVYGSDYRDDCHDIEAFIEDMDFTDDPVLIVKTPDGYVVDLSEAYEEDLKHYSTVNLADYERDELGVVIGLAETHDGATQMYRLMKDRYGVDFEEQVNSLLAEYSSLTAPDENEE